MTTAKQRITLDEPVELLMRPVPDGDDEDDSATEDFRFDPDQPRRSDGRWGSGGAPGLTTTEPLTGEKALTSAPVRLTRPPGGHGGNYDGADITGPPGHGSALALAEMEGVEHEQTNNYLRNVGKPPPPGWRPPSSPEGEERARRREREIMARVTDLDQTMSVSPLPEPVVVYRGVKDGSVMFGNAWYGKYLGEPGDSMEQQDAMWELWEAGERPDLTGVTWEEKAYSHTTVNGGRLAGYAKKIMSSMEPVAMTITVPAGTHAVQMSEIDHEAELMLERGLRYRVVADHGVDDGGVRRLDVEVIPRG
jgi:ADP-ribosyltransferase exoenzyme